MEEYLKRVDIQLKMIVKYIPQMYMQQPQVTQYPQLMHPPPPLSKDNLCFHKYKQYS